MVSSRWSIIGFVLLLLLSGWSTDLSAQSTSDLKERRQELLREIRANTGRLNKTRRTQAQALEQLTILQDQISKREELIYTLKEEVDHTDRAIVRNQ